MIELKIHAHVSITASFLLIFHGQFVCQLKNYICKFRTYFAGVGGVLERSIKKGLGLGEMLKCYSVINIKNSIKIDLQSVSMLSNN